ncbi:hypothetical protein L9W80_15815 [Vibrio aestuarianus]|uniref:hypothetical protein n=1 Tax=Vibrio aestuarianus TaxID=28171 RepID=UPI00237C671C|nr:hypothetical protein [Vibrio aestuarianus]MDE1351613.1 hypothetical protein [Vibrio aestuarianus]
MKQGICLLISALITLASPISWACSYDGQFNNPFSESYPGSLDVAIATQQAIRDQLIETPQRLDGGQGLRRASWWLNLMVERNPNLPSGAYIYLVDRQLWSQYQAGNRLTIHVDAPDPSAEVMLISEAALSNVISDKMTLNQARDLGVVIW